MSDSTVTQGPARQGARVLGTYIDALDWGATIGRILQWTADRESRTVCLCNAHSSVTALDNADLANALSTSDMVLPDGAPVAWVLRRKGFRAQTRIAGPDLMLRLCEALQDTRISVFLFGSSEATLSRLQQNLKTRFPRLIIKGALSPKFGTWTQDEETHYTDTINRSGAAIIFVGLGCPRQEIWMAKHSKQISGVLLGVGAAFDFHAGTIQRAPEYMQRAGLEWLHRLASEPKRLWRRYLVTNSYFLWHAVRDLLQHH